QASFASIGASELAALRELSRDDRCKLFNPGNLAIGRSPEMLVSAQGTVGKPVAPRYGQQDDHGDAAKAKNAITGPALATAHKDPLLATVNKVLEAKGAKVAQKEADLLVKALGEKHGKGSRQVAQVLLELGALFQSKKEADVAKGFYTQGIEAAKAALGKDG